VVSRQYPDKDAAIAFLEGVIAKLRETRELRIDEPILHVKMQIAAIHLDKGSQKECKNLLEEGKTTLDGMTDVDPTVHASFYWISSQYHKSLQEFAEFYKNALLYLAYTTVGSLSEAFKLVSFAVNNNTSCTKSAILFYFQNVPWMLVLLIVDSCTTT
jgi:26S proteasome regulatory subunit N9